MHEYIEDHSGTAGISQKSVIFIVNQLEHFPVAMLSCMIKPSSIICDKDQMRFIYFVRFRGEYPYDIQELMPHFGRFFSECLPSVCKRDKRVKQFIEKCEKKLSTVFPALCQNLTK